MAEFPLFGGLDFDLEPMHYVSMNTPVGDPFSPGRSVTPQPSSSPQLIQEAMAPPPNVGSRPTQQSRLLEPGRLTGEAGTRRRKAPTLRDSDWAPHKARIIELHITQKLPLAKVAESLKSETGFDASQRQYRSRITKWGLDKNVKSDEMRFIAKKQALRMREEPHKGERRFQLRRAPVSNQKIERWIERTGFDMEGSSFNSPIPETPTGLEYWTTPGGESDLHSPTPSQRLPIPPEVVEVSCPGPDSEAPSPAPSSLTVELSTSTAFQGQSPRLAPRSLTHATISPSSQSTSDPNQQLEIAHHTFGGMGRSEEVALRRELAQAEQEFGQDHGKTLTLLETLGGLLCSQSRYKSAETVYRRFVLASKTVYGERHEITIYGLAWLGDVLCRQGYPIESEKLLRRAHNWAQDVEGINIKCSIFCTAILAFSLSLQGKYIEATALRFQVLERSKQVYGESHLKTLGYTRHGRMSEPESLYQQVLHARHILDDEENRGIGRTILFNCLAGIGDLYRQQDRFNEAEHYITEGFQLAEESFGRDHGRNLGILVLLASLGITQGRLEDSEAVCNRVFEGASRVLGVDHPLTLVSRELMAEIHLRRREYQAAEELSTQILESRKKVRGQEHPESLSIMVLLSRVWYAQGRYEQAVSLLEGCVETSMRVHPNLPQTSDARELLESWKSKHRMDMGRTDMGL